MSMQGTAIHAGLAYRSRRDWLLLPALFILILFFGFPLYDGILRSIGLSNIPGVSSELTWSHYEKLFFDSYYRGIIYETLKVSVINTFLCLLAGYPVAYFMVRQAGRWAAPLMFLLLLPLLTSIIMRTFGWNVLFARQGLFNKALLGLGIIEKPLRIVDSPVIVYIGMMHVMIPFMVLSIIPVLRSIDQRLEESARILGAGAMRTFFLVTLPLSMEGIITGCLIVFMITNGSFVTMLLLGHGSVVTLPLLIYQQFNQSQNMAFASAMGSLLLIVVLICLYLQHRLVSRYKE